MGNRTILILNKNYEAIKIGDIFDGISKVYSGKAYFLDKNFQRYTFEEWIDYSKKLKDIEEDLKINSIRFYIYRPYVILMKSYSRYKQPKLNRENLKIRDNNTCQYCGIDLYKKRSTMDHILPKSRGGKMRWDNIVLCCQKCNSKKDSYLPEEIGMHLLREPKLPNLIELFINKNKDQDWLKCLIKE